MSGWTRGRADLLVALTPERTVFVSRTDLPIVIPAYNKTERLPRAVEHLQAMPWGGSGAAEADVAADVSVQNAWPAKD